MSDSLHPKKQIILLTTVLSYRSNAFLEAAKRLGLEIVWAVDMPQKLAEYWQVPLGIEFNQPDKAVQALVEYAQTHPVQAILSIDDSGTLIAARAAETLGLPHNSSQAAVAARNKHEMRRLFALAGVPSPIFERYHLADDPNEIASRVRYPVVLKPLLLSGSRGVIRANTPAEFVAAFERLRLMLPSTGADPDSHRLLVEQYIPGFEVALEGILHNGQLKVLALFDKPDPLEGPFFEETIYVTPSRLPAEVQAQIAACAGQAAAALGLRIGPVHAELRVNDEGPWLVEMAGRSIGGHCSRTLRFEMDVSLEELILRQAAGLEVEDVDRTEQASGVMMIPIPKAGILREVRGLEEAKATPGIDEIQISAPLNNPLVPLPEGASYLGFIFASGDSPDLVEMALRRAHEQLHFKIEETLPVFNSPAGVIPLQP